jgi:hypothetical protein
MSADSVLKHGGFSSAEEYRQKILWARSLTESERFAEALRLTDKYFAKRAQEIRDEFPHLTTDQEVIAVLRERMDREQEEEERGMYIPVPPDWPK